MNDFEVNGRVKIVEGKYAGQEATIIDVSENSFGKIWLEVQLGNPFKPRAQAEVVTIRSSDVE